VAREKAANKSREIGAACDDIELDEYSPRRKTSRRKFIAAKVAGALSEGKGRQRERDERKEKRKTTNEYTWKRRASRGQVEMTWNGARSERAMRRMTGKQKKPIISGNLGAAARDPRNREMERQRRRERETSSRDRTNERPAEASFYNNAMRRIARAVQRAMRHGRRRQQPCDYPSANILAARTPTRPSRVSSLFSPLVRLPTRRHDRARDYAAGLL